ncbi:MAG: hypothetical protein WC346_17340 [Methanogenium sp.]
MNNTLYYVYEFSCPKCGKTKLICTKDNKDAGFYYCIECTQFRMGSLFLVKMLDPLHTEVCPICFDIVPTDENGNCVNCNSDTNYNQVYTEFEEDLAATEVTE